MKHQQTQHQLSQEDRDFLDRFESCRLAAGSFDHRSHLRLAYALLTLETTLGEARTRLREDLLRYLDHLGVDASKYHETLSVSWLLAVQHFMHRTPPARSWQQFIEGNEILLDKDILFTHYSREVMGSAAARMEFVVPDRDPIPGQELAFG